MLSAKTEPALGAAAARLATHLKDNPDLELGDVAYSLVTTRALFEYRAVVTGGERGELIAALSSLAQGDAPANVHSGVAQKGKLAFLFTGQGAQRAGMGKELYEASPVFARALDEVCEAFDQHLDRSLKELLFAEEDSEEATLLDQTAYTQPALFAIETALFRLTEALGMAPSYLAGHSIGEIAAAHVAGVLSLEDAARLVAARGRLMGGLPEGGAMIAIEATEAEVQEAIEGKEQELSIAAVNGPTAIVISGKEKAAEEVQAHFEDKGKKTKRLAVSHAFHSPLIESMLEEFSEVAKSLDWNEPKIPVLSNLTGEVLTAEQATDPAYWVSHVREAVRFADSVETLDSQGVTTYLELGPEGVLTAMATTCLPEDSGSALIATLRSGRPEPEAMTGAISRAHASGAKLDWAKLHPGARRVPLPTYPFQRERFWLNSTMGAGDVSSAGLSDPGHPLLGAAIEDPQGEGLTLTGRISLATHPWLADHAVFETPILPGTAFLELALQAAERCGAAAIGELTLQAPLPLPEQGAIQLQVNVSGQDESGNREISIHSRPQDGEEGEAPEWTTHASGTLTAESKSSPPSIATWPPEGAEPVDVEFVYDRFAERGLDYGPAFQGLTAAWRNGTEVYAEVSLAEEQAREAARFAVHPALLDSAFHAGLDLALGSELGAGGPALPFIWSGVRVDVPGPSSLRARVAFDGDRFDLTALDESNAPLVSVESVMARPVEESQLQASGHRKSLYRVEWTEVEVQVSANGSQPPRFFILGEAAIPGVEAERCAGLPALLRAIDAGEGPVVVMTKATDPAKGGPVETAHSATRSNLELLQAWVAEEGLEAARLVLVTEGAVATGRGEDPDLAAAPLWGLMRSAHSEHPGRFALLDTDGAEASRGSLEAALAAGTDEPQLALREGRVLAPRMMRVGEPERQLEGDPIPAGSTVLITGGTGGLGGVVARHLVAEHGIGHLLLISRSGEESEGAKELKAELSELGAEVTIAACDVTEREQLGELIDSIPPQHPLGAVIHAAGILDDSLLTSMDRARLERVMRPKVDAAWHLHELTRELGLSRFLMFSSSAGLFGGAGQGNYAAANAFLDALAAHRHAMGLPATALAWGKWDQESGTAADLSEAELSHVLGQIRQRLGFVPMSPEQGVALLDLALGRDEPLLAPVELDARVLREQARDGSLLALLRGLVRMPARRASAGDDLASRLAGLGEHERSALVLDFVRTQVAAVLGHGSARSIDPERSFRDLGFDSLAAVELRNRLGVASGMRLPATLVFDYPSSAAIAGYLLAEAQPADEAVEEPAEEPGGGSPEPADDDLLEQIQTMDIDDLVERTLERQGVEVVFGDDE